MKEYVNKSCNDRKCPYFDYVICPYREECEKSKDLVWKKAKGDK